MDFIKFTSIDPYLKYADKYGDIVHYKLSRGTPPSWIFTELSGGDFVLLSSAELIDYAYNSPAYDGRLPNDYFGYTYGRAAGITNGTFATAITNANGPVYNCI